MLLILNFGTFTETNRFAALATSRGFVHSELMADHPPGALVVTGGVRIVPARGFTSTVSFYGLNRKVWRGKISGGTTFKARFEQWMQTLLGREVTCLYVTGHHWMINGGGTKYTTASWSESGSDFSVRFEAKDQRLTFGCGGDRLGFDTTTLRKNLKLIVGFGCNVATGINSSYYRAWSAPSTPTVLAWDRSISIPRSRSGISVNQRLFDYVDELPKTLPKLPVKDRLAWLDANAPDELVRAWGHATIPWLQRQARARSKAGDFYRFSVDRKAGTAKPVRV